MDTQPRFGFAVEYVGDLHASKRFYTSILGLEVEREHPTFVQFHNFAIASDQPSSGEKLERYWLVDEQMPFGKVLRIDDPDGKPCFLLELAQNRPSREIR